MDYPACHRLTYPYFQNMKAHNFHSFLSQAQLLSLIFLLIQSGFQENKQEISAIINFVFLK